MLHELNSLARAQPREPSDPLDLMLDGSLSIWPSILPLGVCPAYPFFFIICCLLVADLTRVRLSEGHFSQLISRCVSHTVVSNASYSSLLMPPLNLRMSSFDKGELETEGIRGGGWTRTLERPVYFASLTKCSLNC